MSEFTCSVVRIKIESHPAADQIEIAKICDYQSIVKKGAFKDGDLAVYIPEASVLPEWLLRHMGFWNETALRGTLNGAAGNRVKAIKLRGVLSQGLVLDTSPYSEAEIMVISPPHEGNQGMGLVSAAIGTNVAEDLGITKYEPALPSHMAGKAIGLDMDITHNYDFENLKKHPELFEEGEEVVITEKIHGTLLQIIAVPKEKANERFYKGRVVITSKGLGGRGIILDHTDETNLYAQCVAKHGLLDKMFDFAVAMDANEENKPIVLFGEVFGRTAGGAGVQDMTYNDQTLDFRAFDMCTGVRGEASFFTEDGFAAMMAAKGIYRAPVLYHGPYSKAKVLELTDGKTTLIGPRGTMPHIREGVVVKSADEVRHPKYGRKIAKSVSEAYLMRKTENATEYA